MHLIPFQWRGKRVGWRKERVENSNEDRLTQLFLLYPSFLSYSFPFLFLSMLNRRHPSSPYYYSYYGREERVRERDTSTDEDDDEVKGEKEKGEKG